ncbi:MAG: pilus assembly protein TadG-related protein [Pseudomonadota bacterium]
MAKSTGLKGILRNSVASFGRDESGSMVVFSLYIFIVMVMMSGLAVDIMRYENKRTQLQNTMDRAVLAAADRDQLETPTAVATDYLIKAGIPEDRFTVEGETKYAGDVSSSDNITSRWVEINADFRMGTAFFNDDIGPDYWTNKSSSRAEEKLKKIEISLILDVSGSMRGNKLSQMQAAAKGFVEDILIDTLPDQVTISVIPYSTQVNIGADLFSYFATTNEHDYSHCIEFDDADFENIQVSTVTTMRQASHFDPWSGYWHGTVEAMNANTASDARRPTWVCRTDDDFAVQPWSDSISDISLQIDGFRAEGNTSIDIAVKWGSALLDPSTRSIYNAMLPQLSPDLKPGRPFNHSTTDDVEKILVVMTDGINTSEYRLNSPYRSGGSGVYKDPDTGQYSMFSEEVEDQDADTVFSEPVWYARNYGESTGRYWQAELEDGGTDTGNAYELTWPQLFAEMSISHRAFSHYYEQYWNADTYYAEYWAPFYYTDPADKDTNLGKVCTAAKSNDIEIYSIGFEVTDASAIVMEGCASTGNHFYRVTGDEIDWAFASIANQINLLKLTQ